MGPIYTCQYHFGFLNSGNLQDPDLFFCPIIPKWITAMCVWIFRSYTVVGFCSRLISHTWHNCLVHEKFFLLSYTYLFISLMPNFNSISVIYSRLFTLRLFMGNTSTWPPSLIRNCQLPHNDIAMFCSGDQTGTLHLLEIKLFQKPLSHEGG